MIDLRLFDSLGRHESGWLSARHHFSFAEYLDPGRMGVGPLRVWNDDCFRPGGGFPMHPHRDMEIITYVRRGAISHEDHLGNRGRTEAGDVQVMSAGRGILHSEFNHEDEDTTLFQIWIEPAVLHVPPRWDARAFPRDGRSRRLVPLASGRAGANGEALRIHQDAALLGATLAAGQSVSHPLGADRRAYLVPASGRLEVNGVEVGPGDGAAIAGEEAIAIRALELSELVLADLP